MKLLGLSQLLFAGAGMMACQQTTRVAGLNAAEFGVDIFISLCEEKIGENVLISPLSIIMALGLLQDGATIKSRNHYQLKSVLHPVNVDKALSLYQQSDKNSQSNQKNGVELLAASSIWTDSLKQSYIELAKSKHFADTFPSPKKDLYAVMNHWIADQTEGAITNLFDPSEPVDPNLVAVLVNAVYFKGIWLNDFNKSDTVDGDFHTGSKMVTGEKMILPARYMVATREMKMTKRSQVLGNASVLVLDYGQDASRPSEFSAVFILPGSANQAGMNEVLWGLRTEPLTDIFRKGTITNVKLMLPRFKINYGPTSLKKIMTYMGMTQAFSSTQSGMFNEMSDDPNVYIDDVFHGAAMEVTEEGTIATAATAAKMKTRSAPGLEPVELTFNRPFVVSIIHRPSGIPVFIGRVEKPELIFGSKEGNDDDDEVELDKLLNEL